MRSSDTGYSQIVMPVALITGANRGIGLEVCRQLASRGYRVVLSARSLQKAEAGARLLQEQVHPIELDVTSTDSISLARAQILERFGRVDVLVNNAGILLNETATLFDVRVGDFRETLETNVVGAIAVSQEFVPGMVARGFGRVVNVSSRAGQLSTMSDYAPAYSVSKAALNAFTRQLAAATNGTGVLVNAVCPGWVRTDMGGRNAPRSVAQGADTVVWAATLPDDGPTGGFFSDRKPIEW
jgi:NAD(P)-dependent dehydrogenase (short-subunit alcohol dehydrogenase family)